MKKIAILAFVLSATPVFAQEAFIVDSVIVDEPAPVVIIDELTATPTDILEVTSEIETVATNEEEQESVVISKVDLIPGSITLEFSAVPPVAFEDEPKETKQTGLFDLIYIGFEEFVFKVFGV